MEQQVRDCGLLLKTTIGTVVMSNAAWAATRSRPVAFPLECMVGTKPGTQDATASRS
jgi:hypothetical protein